MESFVARNKFVLGSWNHFFYPDIYVGNDRVISFPVSSENALGLTRTFLIAFYFFILQDFPVSQKRR